MLVVCNNRGHQSRIYREVPLTLAQISPSWNDRLNQLPISKMSFKWMSWYYQMQSPEICIVGESFGFSSSYRDECDECLAFSQRFPADFKAGSYSELRRNVKGFVDHYNDKHRDHLAEHPIKRKLRWFDSFLRFDDHVYTYR